MQSSSKLTAVDLFSGPGGMTLGLKMAGFEIVGSIEVEKRAAESYTANHPEVPLTLKDIREVDPTNWMKQRGIQQGELTLLAACPPCQGFSSIRTRNSKSPAKDERNGLLLEVLRFSRILMPKAVLMENVPGLLKDDRALDLLLDLKKLGFEIGKGLQILNAADFGVPQNRRRVVLLASRIGRIDLAKSPKLASPNTVRSAIESLDRPGNTGDRLHDLGEQRTERVKKIIRSIPKDGGSRSDLPPDLRLDCHKNFNGFKDVYGRMAWDKPAPTITGGCHNPSKGRFLHPEQDRNITLREAALLQGFPQDYYFSLKGGKLRAAAMIGNALPPPFVSAHAEEIAKSALEGS